MLSICSKSKLLFTFLAPLHTKILEKKPNPHNSKDVCVCVYTLIICSMQLYRKADLFISTTGLTTQVVSCSLEVAKLLKGMREKDSRLLLLLKASLNSQLALCYHNSTTEISSHQLAKHNMHPFKEHRKWRG